MQFACLSAPEGEKTKKTPPKASVCSPFRLYTVAPGGGDQKALAVLPA